MTAAAIADAPERRPVILAPRDAAGVDTAMRQRALPYVLGGRDFAVTTAGSVMGLSVGDERYSDLALGSGDDPELAGVAVAVGICEPALVGGGQHLGEANALLGCLGGKVARMAAKDP